MLGHVKQILDEGGFFMYLNICSSIATIALVIERVIFLYFKYNINGEVFMTQIQKLVMSNNIERAIKLCNAAPAAALPRVIKAGLTRANRSEIEIQNAVEEAILDVLPPLKKRTDNLQHIANIATMLGLLGTVSGLIRAFAAIALAAPDQKAVILSRGIAEAMNNTAFGLSIAVCCILAHLFLSNVTRKIIDELDQYSVKLENMLAARNKGDVNPLDRTGAAS
ncbi:MAG: MotA/TolQ/ExbB proton channel family protein [Deltaproteobacteria bacterium]|nr:MotA/TolQ/ExbB proton channel family protein [Deltaproteobacteria bacterium]